MHFDVFQLRFGQLVDTLVGDSDAKQHFNLRRNGDQIEVVLFSSVEGQSEKSYFVSAFRWYWSFCVFWRDKIYVVDFPPFLQGRDNFWDVLGPVGVVGWCKGAVYLTSQGRPTDISLQLGKACYPCSR